MDLWITIESLLKHGEAIVDEDGLNDVDDEFIQRFLGLLARVDNIFADEARARRGYDQEDR